MASIPPEHSRSDAERATQPGVGPARRKGIGLAGALTIVGVLIVVLLIVLL
jgi:hypothetical protein